jgi:hypothetical protein
MSVIDSTALRRILALKGKESAGRWRKLHVVEA